MCPMMANPLNSDCDKYWSLIRNPSQTLCLCLISDLFLPQCTLQAGDGRQGPRVVTGKVRSSSHRPSSSVTVYTGKIAALFTPGLPSQSRGCGDISRGRLPPVINIFHPGLCVSLSRALTGFQITLANKLTKIVSH